MIASIPVLPELPSLTALRLDGNPITHMHDIISLTALPNLTALVLDSPEHAATPITLLPTYPHVVLAVLPRLTHLDALPVDPSILSAAVTPYLTRWRAHVQLRDDIISARAWSEIANPLSSPQSAALTEALRASLIASASSEHVRFCHVRHSC